MAEVEEAVTALANNPAIRSESYFSPMNGTSAKCSQGVPESLQTQTNLFMGGFSKTEAGFEEALRSGWAHINMEEGGRHDTGRDRLHVYTAVNERRILHDRQHSTGSPIDATRTGPASP